VSRDLPARANLEHLKKQAKAALRDVHQQDPETVARFRSLASRPASDRPTLADAQHVIAREYGFPTWAALKDHVESLPRTADPWDALATAVRANDADRAAALLRRHPELGSVLNRPMPGDAFGTTLLIAAARWENPQMIDLLLGHGADINARSEWWAGGFGVLELCAPEFAPALIERGAAIDVHVAARLGMLETLDAFVSATPGLVHARAGDGHTPLHVAGTIEAAQYLLDRGADMDVLDVDHESTPAQYMVRDRQAIARLLVRRECRTDILMAAALGDLALARRFLHDDPASVRTRVSGEYFPMRDARAGGTIYNWTLGRNRNAHAVAREFGHEDIVRLLMDWSSDELKLARACDLGDDDVFTALLARRPNLAKTLSDDERRGLVEAAQNNNTDAVRRMLAAGWPVDVRGDNGATPLHIASWLGNAEMVRELLRHGAPVEVREDEYNLPPLSWSLHGSRHSWRKDEGDYGATVEALLDAGATAPELTSDLEASAPVREALGRFAERKRTAAR
jgi:ankyrin repeat protein